MKQTHEPRRQVYVAEHHPREWGDVWLRARCSMCTPRWSGPLHTALAIIAKGRAMDPKGIEAELRDRARADALAHADRFHNGAVVA